MKKIKYFICPVCRERKQRGQLVKIKVGRSKGVVIKTCRRILCKQGMEWDAS